MKKTIIILIITLTINIQKLKGQTNCLDIGVNLFGTQYWSDGENPFKDYMKFSSDFFAYYDYEWDSEVIDSIPRDENGYPNAGIPYTVDLGGTIGVKDLKVRKMISAKGRIPQTNYVFLYDGTGTLSFEGDISVTNTSPGRIELICNGGDDIYVNIEASSTAPNHLKNFRLVRLQDETTYETDIWRQEFVDKISPFSAIRFMDWVATNDSPIWQWNQRTSKDYNTQSEKSGAAYEYVIQMCNDLGKDCWICVPHMADSNYMVQMARLFRDNLNAKQKIYLEYSNEVWNWQFQQASWVVDDFTWLDPSYPHNQFYDNTKSQPYNTGILAKRLFKIWYKEFGDDSLRVKRVLACQHANPWVAEEMISALGTYYDYISPAWYFGADPETNFPSPSTLTAEEVIDSCRHQFYNLFINDFKQHYTIANREGKRVIHYEGGQHITAFGDETYPGLQAFYDAQVHPNMYDLYDDVLDSIRTWGSELAMAYTLGSGDSPDGSWGQIKDVDMTPTISNAPKYIALTDNVPTAIGCDNNLLLQTKIFLEGPYNSTTHQMDANLGSNLPKTSPYPEDPRTVNSIPADVVDWVLVQLRADIDSSTTVISHSAFLNKDGRVVADDGTTGEIKLNAAEGNYYIVIKHRNHLAVMSANTIPLNSTTSTLYDFTTGSDKYYGNDGAKKLE